MKLFPFAAVSVLALAGLLSGCGSLVRGHSNFSRYQMPADTTDTAQVRMISNGVVKAVPDSTCIDWRKPGAGVMAAERALYATRNDESLGMPINAASDSLRKTVGYVSTELKVPANRPLVVEFSNDQISVTNTIVSCAVAVSFVPLPGENYQMILTQNNGCNINVRHLDSAGNATTPAPVVHQAELCNPNDVY